MYLLQLWFSTENELCEHHDFFYVRYITAQVRIILATFLEKKELYVEDLGIVIFSFFLNHEIGLINGKR